MDVYIYTQSFASSPSLYGYIRKKKKNKDFHPNPKGLFICMDFYIKIKHDDIYFTCKCIEDILSKKEKATNQYAQ